MAADAVLDPASLHLVGWTLGSVHRASAHGVPARTFLIHWNIPRRWSFLGSRASVAQSRVPRGICIATRSPLLEGATFSKINSKSLSRCGGAHHSKTHAPHVRGLESPRSIAPPLNALRLPSAGRSAQYRARLGQLHLPARNEGERTSKRVQLPKSPIPRYRPLPHA